MAGPSRVRQKLLYRLMTINLKDRRWSDTLNHTTHWNSPSYPHGGFDSPNNINSQGLPKSIRLLSGLNRPSVITLKKQTHHRGVTVYFACYWLFLHCVTAWYPLNNKTNKNNPMVPHGHNQSLRSWPWQKCHSGSHDNHLQCLIICLVVIGKAWHYDLCNYLKILQRLNACQI